MKNKFAAILGVAVLSFLSQRAFTQVQIIGNPQQLNPAQSAAMGAQFVAPVAGAVNAYVDRQNQAQAAQIAEQNAERQLQLDAESAAQALAMQQKQAQEETSYPATTIPNAFSQFYQDRVGASITNLPPYSGNTKISTLATTTTNDIKELQRSGYGLIGVSAFQGPPQSQDAVMVQAKKVGADVVLLSSARLESQQISVDRYQYAAGFFRKMKTPVLGIIGLPLPSEIRQQLERNTGVFVGIVINDSPAFNANILEGDAILKMNGEDVMSVADLTKRNLMFAGQKVDVEIWRKGQSKTISVQLNNVDGTSAPITQNSTESAAVESAAKADIEQFEINKAKAENGDAEAQDKLGFCYFNGKGVTRDYAEAAKWFRKAADQENAQAQFRLGFCYKIGQGVPQDSAEAAIWFQKSADQGYAKAQFLLGDCYDGGIGVTKDAVEAYKWYNLASAQGNEGAPTLRNIIAASMTPDQIAEAQKLSREFKPHKESASTNSN